MSKIDVTRGAIVETMKARDEARKDSLSMLLSALRNTETNKRSPSMEEEENAIVKKEIRQCQEIFGTAPADREDIKEEAAPWIVVYKEFAPGDISVEQIKEVVADVLAELGIETPIPADKGRVMKVLMSKAKGKADGKAVNEALTAMSK